LQLRKIIVWVWFCYCKYIFIIVGWLNML